MSYIISEKSIQFIATKFATLYNSLLSLIEYTSCLNLQRL